MKKIIVIIASLFFLNSCVTMKKYNELEALSDKYLNDKLDCAEKLDANEEELDLIQAEKASLEAEINKLKSDYAKLELTKNQLTEELGEYKKLNDDLFTSKKAILNEANENQTKLAKQLSDKEIELNKISAQQKALDAQLKAREAELSLLDENNKAQSERIAELESRLKEKDEALKALKANISDALKGFSSEEIQVVEKNGKLHVSLSENLLFKSGSFTVDPKGEEAIVKLAEVLKSQDNFDILVEGHTDNDPFNGSGVLKDNWDLSVKRATSVVRILTEQGDVPPVKVAASGRGEFVPVVENISKEDKAKNRRTEIILSPKLDKIMDLINKN